MNNKDSKQQDAQGAKKDAANYASNTELNVVTAAKPETYAKTVSSAQTTAPLKVTTSQWRAERKRGGVAPGASTTSSLFLFFY